MYCVINLIKCFKWKSPNQKTARETVFSFTLKQNGGVFSRKTRRYETWTHLFRPDPFINAAHKPVWTKASRRLYVCVNAVNTLNYWHVTACFVMTFVTVTFRSHTQLICNDLLQNRWQNSMWKTHRDVKGWCTSINLNTLNILVSPWQHAKKYINVVMWLLWCSDCLLCT